MDTHDSNKAVGIINRIVDEIITPSLLPNFGGHITSGNTNLKNYHPVTPNQFPDNTAQLCCKISNFILKNSIYSIGSKKSLFIHYTSIENCINIVNEGKIRLYSVNHLQDPNEYKYLDNFFKNSHVERTSEIIKNMHLISMCEYSDENSEEFDLWRLYGKDGNGVALVFEIDNINLDYWESICIGKVDYSPKIEELEKLNKRYNELICQISNHFDVEMEEAFLLIKLFSKKTFYSSEKEIRIIKKATNGLSTLDFEENKIDGYALNYKNEISNYTSIYLNNLKDISAFYTEDEKVNDVNSVSEMINGECYSIKKANLFRYPKIKLKEIIIGYNRKNQDSTKKNLNKIISDVQRKEFHTKNPDKVTVRLSKFYNDFN